MVGPGYRSLFAWQKGPDLVEAVYRTSGIWPREELFGLTSQARRAAVSVPANVAEGQGRANPKEFLRYLAIAYGSLCELGTHLEIARRLNYLDDARCHALTNQSTEVAQLLHGLIKQQRALVEEIERDKNQARRLRLTSNV